MSYEVLIAAVSFLVLWRILRPNHLPTIELTRLDFDWVDDDSSSGSGNASVTSTTHTVSVSSERRVEGFQESLTVPRILHFQGANDSSKAKVSTVRF